MTLRVGDLLYGFCRGEFGHSYWNKRVEAIGSDWIVARDTCGGVVFYEGPPEDLEQYKTKEEDLEEA